MKAVVSDPKTGKSYSIELDEAKSVSLNGKNIGEKVDGSLLGLEGYELEITGGSDKSGFPMRKDIFGSRKIKTILTKGVGFRGKKGERKKKTVRGNTISQEIAQVNMKIIKHGNLNLDEMFGKKEEKKD